jgi:hypothetical protein
MSIHHEEESDCDNTSFDNFLVDSPLKVILHYSLHSQTYFSDHICLAVTCIMWPYILISLHSTFYIN